MRTTSGTLYSVRVSYRKRPSQLNPPPPTLLGPHLAGKASASAMKLQQVIQPIQATLFPIITITSSSLIVAVLISARGFWCKAFQLA
jgi:hypothetical protein